MYKQLIIARKDLNMSPGKLAAQVSHASIAFLLEKILWGSKEVVRERDGIMYHMDISLDTDLFHDWILKLFAARRIKMIYCGRSKQLKSLVWRSIKITF